MKEPLRAYFFQNFYLQGIHAGIQTAHTVAEMSVKYSGYAKTEETELTKHMYGDWARDHKTIIVLNGGMQSDLELIADHLRKNENPYPWDLFREDKDALNGALTNVGIVLPEKVFEYNNKVREHQEHINTTREVIIPDLTDWEIELTKILGSCRLMS